MPRLSHSAREPGKPSRVACQQAGPPPVGDCEPDDRAGANSGGSDSNSGLTASPALGNAVDRLVRQGALAPSARPPEIYGAKHLLTRRAVTEAASRKLL